MAVYSYAQLETLWINAGGSKALAPVAAAIAEAESGGNSDAYNGNDSNGRGGTQVSAGLWQISNGTMAPVPNWANPATNAQYAVAKYKAAGGWSPWGTYTSGAYRAFLSNSTTPDPNVPGSATQLAAQATAASTADCLVGGQHVAIFFGMGPSLPCLFTYSNARGWIGVGLVLAGGAIMLPGLLLVAASVGTRALAGPVNEIQRAPVIGSYTRRAAARATASAP
jgi:hypothetical protein